MAEEVHTEYIKNMTKHENVSKTVMGNTQLYSDEFKKNVTLESEDEFKSFLVLNYDCSMLLKTTPVFNLKVEQNTAMEEYERLLEDLEFEGDGELNQWTLVFFTEVYEDFSDLANRHLKNAFLQPINGRDLYDLILIYSAYCNINKDKFD